MSWLQLGFLSVVLARLATLPGHQHERRGLASGLPHHPAFGADCARIRSAPWWCRKARTSSPCSAVRYTRDIWHGPIRC
jgi:hypothetical protein